MSGVQNDQVEDVQVRADSGDAQAQYDLGCLYRDRSGSDEDKAAALQWFRLAADQGHAFALGQLARCYLKGDGVPEDEGRAVAFARRALEAGDPLGARYLGWAHEFGKAGVQQSMYDAVNFYLEGAQGGDPGAQTSLGVLYEDGKGVPKSHDEAVMWYRKAAAQGHSRGELRLGLCYEEGIGVEQSWTEAAAWYRKVAEQGDSWAQEKLAWCYSQGKGVSPSWIEAAGWWQKAADAGRAVAQFNLGVLHENGNGAPQSWDEAIRWYRKSAEQGYAPAQAKLGECYRIGQGVAPSLSESLRWSLLALAQNNGAAQTTIRNGYKFVLQYGDDPVDVVVAPVRIDDMRITTSSSIVKGTETRTEYLSTNSTTTTTPGQFVPASGGSIYVPGQIVTIPGQSIPVTKEYVTSTNIESKHFSVVGNLGGQRFVTNYHVPGASAERLKQIEEAIARFDAIGRDSVYLIALGSSGFGIASFLGLAMKTEDGQVVYFDLDEYSQATRYASDLKLSGVHEREQAESKARAERIKVTFQSMVRELCETPLPFGKRDSIFYPKDRLVLTNMPHGDEISRPKLFTIHALGFVCFIVLVYTVVKNSWAFFWFLFWVGLRIAAQKSFDPRNEYRSALNQAVSLVVDMIRKVRPIVEREFVGNEFVWGRFKDEAYRHVASIEEVGNAFEEERHNGEKRKKWPESAGGRFARVNSALTSIVPDNWAIEAGFRDLESSLLTGRIKQWLAREL